MKSPKRLLSLFLTGLLLFASLCTSFSYGASAVPKIEAEAAMVIDMTTGDVLYKQNDEVMIYPASTTKMVTALIALDQLDMNATLTADQEVASTPGTSLKLKDGEEINAKDALNAMLVASCNDCAVLIAKAIAGSTYEFVNMMNDKLLELGVSNTHFSNPHGLHAEDHYSTASDLAKIALQAMENEEFAKIVGQSEYTVPATNKSDSRTVTSTNLLLHDETDANRVYIDNVLSYCKYEGAMGVKTGYTKAAGGCLIEVAQRENTKLMTVVMKSSSMGRFADTIKLLDWGFANFRTVQCTYAGSILEGTVKVKNGAFNKVGIRVEDSIFYTIPSEAAESIITTRLTLDTSTKAPVEEGRVLGVLEVYESGLKVGETHVVANQTIEKGGILSVFGIEDATARKIWITLTTIVVVLVVSLISYVVYMRNKIKKKKAARAAKIRARKEEEKRRRMMWDRNYDKMRYGNPDDEDQDQY